MTKQINLIETFIERLKNNGLRCGYGAILCFTLAACGGSSGGGGNTPPGNSGGTPPPIVDTTPDPFIFSDIRDAEINTVVESNVVTIAGADAGAELDISINNGEYKIDDGEYTSSDGVISSGQTIQLRLTSSSNPNRTIRAVLTINGIQDSFDVTTAGGEPLARGAQNWPMFGGNYLSTRFSPDTLINSDNVDTLRVETRITSAGVSSTPAFVDDTVYYVDYSGRLHAVDAETGENLWGLQLQDSMLTASVFVSGDSIYIAGDESIMYAVNRNTREIRWAESIESTTYNRVWSSPMVVGDTLIIGAASYQVFMPVDGSQLFRGSVVGLDTNTGEEKWRLSVCPPEECGGGVSVWSSAAVDPELGLAYIGTGQAYQAPAGPYSDSLIAFNYQTGERVWHFQYTANDVYTIEGGSLDQDVGAMPNLFTAEIDGVERKLVGVGDKGGRYMAFDRQTGEPVWETTLSEGSPIGGNMGTAAVADGKIFLTANTSVEGTGRDDARPGTGIAYALDAATGDPVWSEPLDAGSFSGNTVANGLMYFTTWDGRLRVLSTESGDQLMSIPVGTAQGIFESGGFPNGSTSGAVVANGRIYVGYGWTWGAEVTGGLTILRTDAEPAPLGWAASCPEGFFVGDGLNTDFVHEEHQRSFYAMEATSGEGPRPVFVALTGTAQLETDFLQQSYIDQLPAVGFHVVAPVRICATDGSNNACASGTVSTSDGRTWEPWFDGVADVNVDQYQDEGVDVRFIEAVVKCVATEFNIDQSRIFVGGISAGGTLTNRALTFNSDFFAGGIPASGEWYRADGVGIEVEDVGDLIVEGRAAPRPLNTSPDALGSMINIVLWGGPTDKWYENGATGPLIANYNPSTKLAANYYASQENVVTVSCTHDFDYQPPIGGHIWPSNSAVTEWLANTLAMHPKATSVETFSLPPTPAGLSCRVGSFIDH